MQEIGSVENVRKDGTVEDGYTIDMVFNKLSETAMTDAGATIASELKWCGKTDWAKGKAVELTKEQAAETLCYGVGVPRRVYNRYRVDAGKLYLATDELKDIPADDRPAKINMSSASAFDKK